jgi:hypothetical protein
MNQDAFYFGFASRKVKEKDAPPSFSFGPRPSSGVLSAVPRVVNVHLKPVYPKFELKSNACGWKTPINKVSSLYFILS